MKINYKVLAVFTVIVSIQISLVIKVYAQNDIILQAQIKNQKLQKCGDSYRLVLPAKFRLTNKTDKPLLIIRNAVHLVGTDMAKSESDFEKEIYLYRLFTSPGFIQQNLLKLKSPTKNRTEVIQPNNFYEWDSDQWYAFNKITVDPEPNPVQFPNLSLEKLQSVDYLWIKYEIAFFPMNSMGEEGTKLQKSWEKFGHLLLKTIPTQAIKISVPKEIAGSCN